MENKQRKDIGAIWRRNGAKGEYLSISIETPEGKFNYVAFVNNYKNSDKQPDYKIYPQMMPQQQEQKPIQQPRFETNKQSYVQQTGKKPLNNEDVPW